MEILFFRSTWGMPPTELESCLRRIKQVGFDGIELGVPDDLKACAEARQLVAGIGLGLVVQQWTRGKTAEEHAASFEQQYQRAAAMRPMHVNSHTGRDYFSLKENLAVLDRATVLEAQAGVPVFHETHRGRALFSATATTALLAERPNLRLTADLSHWCCVHESLLEEQPVAVERALGRSYYVHARVGYSQGPQITDPRDPHWELQMEAHLAWWQRLRKLRQAEGCQTLAFCPEFGPPPYMVTLPHTQQPIADLWEINCYMRDWLKQRLNIG